MRGPFWRVALTARYGPSGSSAISTWGPWRKLGANEYKIPQDDGREDFCHEACPFAVIEVDNGAFIDHMTVDHEQVFADTHGRRTAQIGANGVNSLSCPARGIRCAIIRSPGGGADKKRASDDAASRCADGCFGYIRCRV